MAVVTNVDIEERALALLLPQFKNKNTIESILVGPAETYQTTIDAGFDLLSSFNVDTDNTHTLNLIGKLLNVPRGDESDTEYRRLINTQILINRSTGSSKTLISALDALVGQDGYVITENFPAEVNIRIYKPQDILTEEIINAILPIGVNGVFFQNPYDDKTPWELTDVGGPDNPRSVLPDLADLATTDVVIVDIIFT